MSQLQLGDGEERQPILGRRKADALGMVLLGFVAPGRWDSGAKVPDRIRSEARAAAETAARDLAERLA